MSEWVGAFGSFIRCFVRWSVGEMVDWLVVELLDGWMVGWEIGRRIRWMT